MLNPEDLVLAEAERDVRELEQYLADQRIRVFDYLRMGRGDFDEQERGGTTMIGKSLAHLTYWGMCTVNGPPPTRFVAFNSGDGTSNRE